jgi:hypothetical protein
MWLYQFFPIANRRMSRYILLYIKKNSVWIHFFVDSSAAGTVMRKLGCRRLRADWDLCTVHDGVPGRRDRRTRGRTAALRSDPTGRRSRDGVQGRQGRPGRDMYQRDLRFRRLLWRSRKNEAVLSRWVAVHGRHWPFSAGTNHFQQLCDN